MQRARRRWLDVVERDRVRRTAAATPVSREPLAGVGQRLSGELRILSEPRVKVPSGESGWWVGVEALTAPVARVGGDDAGQAQDMRDTNCQAHDRRGAAVNT